MEFSDVVRRRRMVRAYADRPVDPAVIERFGFEPGMFPIAETVSQRTIALPFFNDLSMREIDLVAQTLEVMLSRENLTRS